MVRGYHVYSADMWASVVGDKFRKMTNSRLVGDILALHISVELPTGSLLSG